MPEASNLYDELTALDNLVFAMQLYGVPRAERQPRAEALLARFRLADKRDAPFAKLSRHETRTYDRGGPGAPAAAALPGRADHRPRRDERAATCRGMIAALRDEGVTVFLTTHYLEEAERLCDRIAVIVKGRIVALDTVAG